MTGDDAAKHDVLLIEPRRRRRRQEELRAVGVAARVGHRQQERRIVLQLEVFVGKIAAIDRLPIAKKIIKIHSFWFRLSSMQIKIIEFRVCVHLAALTVLTLEIAALTHEPRNDAMELNTLVAVCRQTNIQFSIIHSKKNNNINNTRF